MLRSYYMYIVCIVSFTKLSALYYYFFGSNCENISQENDTDRQFPLVVMWNRSPHQSVSQLSTVIMNNSTSTVDNSLVVDTFPFTDTPTHCDSVDKRASNRGRRLRIQFDPPTTKDVKMLRN
jgi:hypothetical protein